MSDFFAPGCALVLYKPQLAVKVHTLLVERLGDVEFLDICCRNHPEFHGRGRVINTCPGCDKRYRHDYDGKITTISLWEIIAGMDAFQFPDYGGRPMTIIDACPTRTEAGVQDAIRTLLQRMNIRLVEPERTRERSTCCGDVGWGRVSTIQVKDMMRKKAREMPLDDIVVYCVSCAKAMFVGGRKPRYLVDLLFGEETTPGIIEPDEWHRQIDEYTSTH